MQELDPKEIKVQEIRKKRVAATLELEALLKERNNHRKIIDGINSKIKDKILLIRNYSQSIGQIRNGEGKSKVTDHAIVRYLERYKGVDIEAIVNEILEHPDAKIAQSGTVTTIYQEDIEFSKEAKKLVNLAKSRKSI